jgi:hypothetical protein
MGVRPFFHVEKVVLSHQDDAGPSQLFQIHFSMIELLETRIAPASVLTYTDWDGDLVKITASKGTLLMTDLTLSGGNAGQLEKLDLTAHGFEGAAISITVTHKAAGGDGAANVGYIDSTGVDLASVKVGGDLGRIDAGTDTITVPAIGTVTVQSMGAQGLNTQAAGGNLTSTIKGFVKTFKITHDLVDAQVNVAGATGGLSALAIGGSVVGGSAGESGSFVIGDSTHNDNVGKISIGGDVVGNVGNGAGSVVATGTINSITVGGSLIGGDGSDAGSLIGGDLGSVLIKGSLSGGTNTGAGSVIALNSLATAVVRGSLFGGPGSSTGAILSMKTLGNVTVYGSIIGGSYIGDSTLFGTGVVGALNHVGNIIIKGSLISGDFFGSGTLTASGAVISVNADIASVTIDGSIIGNSSEPALIEAEGQMVKPASGVDTALGSLTVKGSVTHANILAGFDLNAGEADADASIGKISVGGNWRASNAVAGAHQTTSPGWGTGDTLQTANNNAALTARIGSIIIAGSVTGSVDSGDNFGFVAQAFGTIKFGGHTLTPSAGSVPVFLNPDVDLEEVS